MSHLFIFNEIKNVNQTFNYLANKLLNEIYICTPTNKYKIIEIEFYYNSENHPDPFVHCDKEQNVPGNWYFHKMHGKSYKEGTYKGLDITFGIENGNSYGGILLRSIQNIQTNEITEGSCSIVNKILDDNNNIKSVKEFVKLFESANVKYYEKDIKPSECPLYLLSTKNLKRHIYYAPRVGLSLKKSNGDRMKYIMKYYRFLTEPTLKKFKCGIILALYDRKIDTKVIAKLTNTKERYITKYIDLFENSKIDKIDIKKNLKTCDLCNIIGYCSKS
jgi:hypothetical protein